MRVQPRQEFLAIWKAVADWALERDPSSKDVVSPNHWIWEGRVAPNATSDAELLLILLLPPRQLPDIRFDHPWSTRVDVVEALHRLGDRMAIPRFLLGLIRQYLERYVDPDTGLPTFSGGSYFFPLRDDENQELTPEQRGLEVVDAYATSIQLAVAVIEFLRRYRREVTEKQHPEIDAVAALARRRLTAAMVGLQRSFAVHIFPADSREGQILCRTVSQADPVPARVVADLRDELRDVITTLGELELGGEQTASLADLADDADLLFECGWSWGIVRGAPAVDTAVGTFDRPGYAETAPYLYFTLVAVDAIAELFDEGATIRRLLDDEQQTLARTLNLQWGLARRYWSTIASFGTGEHWPLTDMPWRTTDGDESDYYTLMASALVLNNLVHRRAPDSELERVAEVLEDLADRLRIRRRPLLNDPVLTMHYPGRLVSLVGSENIGGSGVRMAWRLSDAAAVLLGRALAVAEQVNDSRLRARVLQLADLTWAHIDQRRLGRGRAERLWDQPANVFPALAAHRDVPSWYFTARVVQSLGVAARLGQREPVAGERLSAVTEDLVGEAEHLLDRELMAGSTSAAPPLREELRQQQMILERARRLMRARPGTAVALAVEVLRMLDKLTNAKSGEE